MVIYDKSKYELIIRIFLSIIVSSIFLVERWIKQFVKALGSQSGSNIKSVSNIKDRIEIAKSDYSYQIITNIDEINQIWDRLSMPEHFCRSSYLKAIEADAPEELKSIYIVVNKGADEVGVILAQHLILKLSDSIKYENYARSAPWLKRKWQSFKQWMVSKFEYRLLTIGNLYLTGQYGFHFDQSLSLDLKQQQEVVNMIADDLKSKLKSTPYQFSAILFKDYFEEEQMPVELKPSLHPFQIDPNMILTLNSDWQSFDDYLGAMRSKYRIRMKNAMRKNSPVTKKVLTLDDCIRYKEDMYRLYTDILSGAGFVLVKGQEDYFVHLKKALEQDLKVVGFFVDDQLVAFYTWLMDGDKMDSHFIGVNSSLNLKYQLYLNILLDLVKDGIANKARTLLYFRTALEIKSSVGAEPYEMYCYIRHNNRLLNGLIPIVFKYFVPQQKWTQRHPFKKPVL